MSIVSYKASLALLIAFGIILATAGRLSAQAQPGGPGVTFQVRGAAERLEMTVNSSRVVEFPFDVPRMLVNNPDLVRVIPISPRSIQLSAVRAGVTQLNVWDVEGNVTSIDLQILGDVQELDGTLKTLFPEASLRLRQLNSSLYISGFVPKAEMVNSIVRVAQDYFPQVINDMTVGGVHKVLLHVKVMEVSRTKLRSLGFDWAHISSGGFITQNVSGLLQSPGTLLGPGATVRFGIIGDGGQFYGFLEALRQYDLAKLMAEPTLTTLSGRPASFNVGGEVPIPIQQALGVTTVQYREFGTRIDFVPVVLGNGLVRLEVRPSVTEVDPSLRDQVTGIPGFRTRTADTAVEMKAGQTLAIAGLVYDRIEATNRGLPWLADMPWAGAAFRRVSERKNEVELLIFVTPEFCDAMDPGEVPPCGPGELTTSPTDCELYFRGYMEVPKGGGPGHGGYDGPMYEELPPGQAIPQAPPPPVPAPSSAQRKPAPVIKSTAANSRRPTAATRTVGTGSATASPQNGYSSYQKSGQSQKPSTAAQPTLIGPLGYDDLR
ncbi:MAG TPA: pilus assembly protein N-terminal domain-containing protein [Pirellulaceae bacterium]|nr:pilus assembly protein N-terminal domain-containing protein [Pirellulaceae bacterium]